jgi:NAD(P)-dependent dehydrogenase (short-subunit alcohol dehydrogenase family)
MIDHSLKNLRVAITGGTSGLGRSLVRELVGRGARVAFVARHRNDVQRTMLDVPTAAGIVGDVSQKEDVHPIAIQILGALDGLDVLVNNASSLGPVPLRPLADTDCEDLERALATNLVGPFRLTKALLGALAASARDGGARCRQHLERRRGHAVRELGRVWREQGRAPASEPHLGRNSPSKASASWRSIPATWTRRCTRSRYPTPTGRSSSGRNRCARDCGSDRGLHAPEHAVLAEVAR